MTCSDRIFARIASPRTLTLAWQRVRRNGGNAGLDGIGIEAFAAEAERRLIALSRSLFAGTYRPRRLLLVRIAKPSGGVRQLAVPTLTDRVAQVAAAMVLDRMLDPSFSDASFAYRRDRSVGHALGRVLTHRLWGYRWAFDTDIATFFDSIPQGRLLADLAARIASPKTLDLVRLWVAQAPNRGLGVPQGGPISPLLSNLYLDPVDRAIDSRRIRLVRYADNILLLATEKETARRAGERLAGLLAARGLALNPAKTRLVAVDHAFEFLGYRLGGRPAASAAAPAVPRKVAEAAA
jgi:CRISPR-associated protein Cas1